MENKPVLLVVDDQLQNIILLEGFLVRQGYEIIQAESGEEALAKLSGNQVDLVLLDVKMPGMSGFEVLMKLRADKKALHIPVIMITAHNEKGARVKALESGCDDFISKPFDQYELLIRVKSLLRIKFLNDEVGEARDFAESVINTVREPLISLDQDLRVVAANQSFYDTFKVTPEETIGKYIYDLGNRQWDIPKLRVLFEDILPKDTVFNGYEVEHDFLNIGRKIILLNARQIFRENIGSHIILLAMEDITERKQLAGELQKIHDELTAANIELEAFNYTVSHDLHRPLSAINGYCQVLQKLCSNSLDEQSKGYIQEIYEGTQRMSRLIKALLEFSRISRYELRHVKIDLSKIAEKIALELKASEPERQVTFRITTGITVLGDPDLLRVVLDNLIGNAWKYTVNQVETVIEFGVTEFEGKPACFVRDNGPSFDMALADKLFIPFQRLPGTNVEGHGIGLATVERIIRRHVGRVWAEGEPNKGATFYFTLE
jgi:PAS domain S-box-containing protein